MKLSRYNQFITESKNNDFLLEIKDVFQDIIDDYNLEEIPDDIDENDVTHGIFYYFEYCMGNVEVSFWVGGEYLNTFCDIDMESCIKRLMKMGYGVSFGCEDIIVYDSIEDCLLDNTLDPTYQKNYAKCVDDFFTLEPYKIIVSK